MASFVNCFNGPEEVEDINHARSLLKELKIFYDSNLLVDVTIEVEPDLSQLDSSVPAKNSCFGKSASGKHFLCNRNVLAAASPYFKSMFTGGLYESKQKVVTIHDVDADSMAVIIDYCYTGKVKMTEGNVERLYAAANMLQLEYIRRACSDFMTRRLDLSNCAGILKFADTFGNHDLKSKAQTFIARNFSQLCSKGRELCQLELNHIKEILSLDILDIDCERKVCAAAVQWIEDNAPDNAEDALQVLRCVRWHLFTEKDQFYLDGLKSLPHIQKNILEFLEGSLGGAGSKGEFSAVVPTHRIGKNAKEMILFFGRPNESFICYDPYSEDICCMSSPLLNVSVLGMKRSATETFSVCVTPENDLYLVSDFSKHLWAHDSVLNSWHERAERLLGRVRADIGYVSGHLYVLGGRDPITNTRLKEVECYSVQRNQWTLVAPLPHSLGKMQTVTMNERLYVVNKRRILCYDPKRNHWLQCASLKCNKLHRACIFQDQIFCLFDVPVMKAYSPERGEWRRIGDIPVDSNAFNYQVLRHNDRMLLLTTAIAGRNKNRLLVHEYEPARDCWKTGPTIMGTSFGCTSLSARVYPARLGTGQNLCADEEDDSGSSADWDFDGLTDVDSDSGSSSSFSDENW